MAHQSGMIAEDIHTYLKQQEQKSLLRFITCGSVDDGKSTLIGRLLWDSKMIFEDQLAALEADSKRVGTQDGGIDYALLLDGLQAEREQGITIDVAYRFFSTDRRKFIVADTPGHEQYTRNMVTGASTAQVAVILVDARKGLQVQSRRHSFLASLVGIRHIVLAVNKMDLVAYSAARFELIRKEYQLFASGLGFSQVTAIPLSALNGDNVIKRSAKTPWYHGPTLLDHLESVAVTEDNAAQPFRMRVQWVNRPNHEFRGFSGTISAGTIRPGDEVVVSGRGVKSQVERIVTFDGDLPQAVAGQAVTLTMKDEIDISRGDLLSAAEQQPYHSDRYVARLAWLHEQPLKPGQNYLFKAGAVTLPARVEEVCARDNVNNLQQEPAQTLSMNDVGRCVLALGQAVSCDSYGINRSTGSFILIDRSTNATLAAGMIVQPVEGTKAARHALGSAERALIKGQQAKIVWCLNLSVETVTALEVALHERGLHTHLLDNTTLAALTSTQAEHAGEARVSERSALIVADICAQAGLIVLVAAAGSVPGDVSVDAPIVAIDGDQSVDLQQLVVKIVTDERS